MINFGFCCVCVWVLKTENIVFSGAYAAMGVDNSVRLNEFRKNFKVDIIKMTEEDMEFDLIGIDASIANAFRRILISEVFSTSFAYTTCFYSLLY